MTSRRVLVVTSHPIQYNAPLFRRLAEHPEIDLSVVFCSTLGSDCANHAITAFGRRVVWDVDLLGGYRHMFLNGAEHADPQDRRSVCNPSLIRLLERERPDVLVGFGWAHPTDWLGYAAARALGIPYLLYSDTDVRDRGRSRVALVRAVALRALCTGAAGALFTGTFNRDFYIRFGMDPTRLWFSPWAVETERFALGNRALGRAQLNLQDDVVYAIFAGTLIERKRVLLLLDAIRTLQSEGERIGVILAGSGPLEPVVRERAEALRDTHLLGFVNQRALPDIYAAGDVFVLPSDRDARATVVNEAMAAGLPVIVSTGTGVWGPGDLVLDGREGRVFPAGDAPALTRALRDVLEPSTRAHMAAAARTRIAGWGYPQAVQGWAQAVRAVARAL